MRSFRIRRPLLTSLLVGTLLGSAATLGVLQLTATLPSPPIESLHDPLSTIAGAFRLTEGRTAYQALYAPYPTPPEPRGQQELLRFLRGNVRLLSARQRASVARGRAAAHLLRGHPDAAIADLNSALETAPDDAELLSDLSALYDYRSFTQRRQPEDRLTALASSERAALLAPDAPGPRFNHALALEHLFLWEDARHAWFRYLVIDPRSPWAEEARRHLRTIDLALRTQGLTEPYVRIVEVIDQEDRKELLRLASLSHWEARRALEDVLLSRWTGALAGGDIPKACQLLPGLQILADLLARRTGDRIFQEITGAMADVLASPSTQPRLETMLHPLLLYREALRRYAERDLRGAHSKLEDLGRNVLLAAYPSLNARRICLKGVLAQLEGRPQTALAAYLDARRRAAAIGEESFAAWLDILIAQNYESTGQPALAWSHLEQALAWTSTHPSRSQLVSTLDTVVLFSLRHRRPELALRFQDRLLSVAGTLDVRGAVVSGRLRRARIQAVLGKTAEANLDLQRALTELPFVTHSIQRALLPEINAVREDIETSDGRTVALGTGLRASIPLESLVPELDARADGEIHREEQVVHTDRMIVEQNWTARRQQARSRIQNDHVISFSFSPPPLRPPYEKLSSLSLQLTPSTRAPLPLAASSDRQAAYGLQPFINSSERGWLLYRGLPANTAFVEYSLVEGRLHTSLLRWSSNPFWTGRTFEAPPERPFWTTVSSLVRRLNEITPHDVKSRREVLVRLYALLVSPWQKSIKPGVRLVFVPTHDLYRVPFAALINPRSGRFLVQDHGVSVVPNADAFLNAIERDRQLATQPPSNILLVGNANTAALSPLPHLPAAAREIAALTALYRGLKVELLQGSQATTDRVLTALPAADLVHVGTHAIRDSCDSWRSALVLSPRKSEPGHLSADQVRRLQLPHTRLVVLASCDTYCGNICPSEGPQSLATAFLMAGVPAVVGSLWPVEDESTSRLLIHFHRQLRLGADPLSALRTAQVAQIRAKPDNWTWASFQLIGGVRERLPGASPAPDRSPLALTATARAGEGL